MSASEPASAHTEGPALDLSSLLLPADYPSVGHLERRALVHRDWHWTYAGLDRACDAIVTILQDAGLGAGDRVAYFGRNTDLFFPVLIGTIRAGLVMVPVNWRNTATETRFVLDDSGARLVFADLEFLPVIDAADRMERPRIVVDDPGPDGLRARIDAAAPAPRATIDPMAPGLQLYTSGTTGKPKGVLTSQHALGVQRRIELDSMAFEDWADDEVLLSPMPNFHVGGMSWVLTGLVRGQTVVLTADLTPASLLDLCLAHGVTRTFMVPTLVQALIEEMDRRGVRVPTLRAIHYGAASMSPLLLERSIDRLGCRFLQYYGMTEVTGCMTTLAPQDHDLARPRLLRSVGKTLAGFTTEIRGPDTRLLKVGEPGEIWVKGPSLLIGYWNRPDATAEVLQDGWYRSGDGGMLDAEGFLYLTDRIKDMIVSGGENVYPAEVEAVLRDHPAVLDCAVFGLPHPKWGEGVTAAIELRPGQITDADSLIAYARGHLAAYKIPRQIVLDVVLPRTASGKVQRGALRKRMLEQADTTA